MSDATPSLHDRVMPVQQAFLVVYNIMAAAGTDQELLMLGALTAAMEASMQKCGPAATVDWLRRMADDLERQYPPDVSRH